LGEVVDIPVRILKIFKRFQMDAIVGGMENTWTGGGTDSH